MQSGVLLEFLNMGGGEVALIMVAILLLFGGKKLPELARGLGKGIREFKDASEGVKREIHRNINAVDLENELKEEEQRDMQPNADVTENHSERHHPMEDAPMQPVTYTSQTEVSEIPAEQVPVQKSRETEL